MLIVIIFEQVTRLLSQKKLKHWTTLPGFRTENGSLCPAIFAQTLCQMSRYNIFAVDPRKPL